MGQPKKAYLRSIMAWILGSLAMLICSLACLIFLPFKASADYAHHYTSKLGRFILWVSGVRVDIQGLGNIDPQRAQLIVSNHQGSFDIWALMGCFPISFRWVMKKELFRVPLMGRAMKKGGYVGIDRQHPHQALHDMERVLALLREGKSVIIFPEGTRSRDGKVGEFKRGAFKLAYKAGVPILPISINGSFDIMQKGSWLLSPHPIKMVIHKPVEVAGLDRAAQRQLPEQVRQKVIEHM
jgi:1-acyl-sn-glycerol-3-phosphate acyltransferase